MSIPPEPSIFPPNRRVSVRVLTEALCIVLILLSLGVCERAYAQGLVPRRWVENAQTTRVALVIGNSAYQHGTRLKNPTNDADAVSASLLALGFSVTTVKDGSRKAIIDAIDAFGDKLTANCVALVYYSGHGMQVEGENYLLPVDFDAKKRVDVEFEGVPARRILAQFEEKKSPVNLVILDACRDNPFRGFSRSNESGLVQMNAPRGTLIAYSTSPGSTADDNSEGSNGLYTTQLLKALPTQGVTVEQMFKLVRQGVAAASNYAQVPWDESSIIGDMYLAKSDAPRLKNNRKDMAEMVYIPAGAFQMGDSDRADNPRHTVTLSGYYIYKNLVTVAMYRRYCKATGKTMPHPPSWGWKEDHPMVMVTWDDARAYCEWAGGRLPTDAEWEKAARGTDGRRYPWGEAWDKSKLWCSQAQAQDAGETHAAGGFPAGASPYGVLDMAGNVWQWCEDWYDRDYWSSPRSVATNPVNDVVSAEGRVLRGGSWGNYEPIMFRTANRGRGALASHDVAYFGFRVVIPTTGPMKRAGTVPLRPTNRRSRLPELSLVAR